MKSKNSVAKTKTFEFLALFSMVVGTVVGGGIYMKNSDLLNTTHNPIISIILWAVVGLVCVLSVAVFIEISSSTKHFGNGTLGNWSKLFMSRKVASIISLFYLLIYIPSTEAFFVGSFILYLLEAIGQPITVQNQLMIYLICGICIIASFMMIHILAPKFGRNIQVFGTIFKFIPLVIALIAGFCLVDKTNGTSAMYNNGYEGGTWSTKEIMPTTLMGGFGAILFAFDGYIYIANGQRDVEHKEVVPNALFFGLIFASSFYVLIAISLFLGSPDGSIQALFEKMINKMAPNSNSEMTAKISRIISCSILMIISLLSVNIYTFIGIVNVESDGEVGILYNFTKEQNFTRPKAALYQGVFTIIIYSLMIILGFVVPIHAGKVQWNGMNQIVGTNDLNTLLSDPLILLGQFSSADSTIAFLILSALILSAIRNRKTNKVEVNKVKGFIPLAWISSIAMMLFTIAGVIAFMFGEIMNDNTLNWFDTEGMLFTLFLLISIIVVGAGYFIQERKFNKVNI